MKLNIIKYGIIGVIISLISYSCSKVSVNKKIFPSTQELKAEYINIKEIIKFDNIHKIKDYVIIRNGFINSQYFFYVYSYPDFNFLYSFAPKGNGPEEYLMPTVIKGTQDNLFSFRDHATDKFVTYNIMDSVSVLVSDFHLRSTDGRFMWEINHVNDSIYLLKRNDNKWSRRELWNFSSFNIIDSIPNSFNLVKKMGNDYYSTFDDCWIVSKGNKFAFSYFFIDKIEFGTIKNNKIELEKNIGMGIPPKFYSYNKKSSGGKYKYNVDKNIVYYEALVSGKENIYALYSGIPWGDNEELHSSIIEVYSFNGEAKYLLKLNESISHFIVDENVKSIYGFNVSNTQDAIYKFTYE